MMNVLITGNMGYVGPVLLRHLRATNPDCRIVGYDSGFFAHCLTTRDSLPEIALNEQFFGDVRRIPAQLLDSIDTVIHLAAISNDPMGKRFETSTEEINYRASVEVAALARDAGVKCFVFASSCSVYGYSEGAPRKEADPLNPLTAYSRSKIATEEALAQMDTGDMVVTCLRFATACGMSDRLRLDLVLNDFVACALANGEISVLSDGSPWRPLIDVSDMARAIEWASHRPASNGGRYLALNAGCNSWNFQVGELAEAVAAELPGTRIAMNRDAPPDKRSYRVDFSLFRSLAPEHQPLMALPQTIRMISDGLSAIGFSDPDFRDSQWMRLRVLEHHMSAGRLSPDLRWIAAREARALEASS